MTVIAADNARVMIMYTYVSIPHNDDVSGVTYGCLSLSVDTGAWNPTFGEYVKLGHAQWTIAVDIRRNRGTEDGGGEEGRRKEERRKEGRRKGESWDGGGKEGGGSGRKVVSDYLTFSKMRGKIILPLHAQFISSPYLHCV